MESIYEDEGRGIIWKAEIRKTEMKEFPARLYLGKRRR